MNLLHKLIFSFVPFFVSYVQAIEVDAELIKLTTAIVEHTEEGVSLEITLLNDSPDALSFFTADNYDPISISVSDNNWNNIFRSRDVGYKKKKIGAIVPVVLESKKTLIFKRFLGFRESNLLNLDMTKKYRLKVSYMLTRQGKQKYKSDLIFSPRILLFQAKL